MERLIITISTSASLVDIVEACECLALETRRVLRQLQETLPPATTTAEQFHQAYPELNDMIGKLRSACAQGDRSAAGAAAWSLQTEMAAMLGRIGSGPGHPEFNLHSEYASRYREQGFPDLLEPPPESLSELAGRAQTLDGRLRGWLRERSVDLCEFETIEQLRNALNDK
jgi:hypothetical protein